ncbi:hypothetical protein WAI453_007511 [Rhynchosporium graminicola]
MWEKNQEVFRAMELKSADMILGVPWLKTHNPKVNFRTGQLSRGDDSPSTDSFCHLLAAIEYLHLTESAGDIAEGPPGEDLDWQLVHTLNNLELDQPDLLNLIGHGGPMEDTKKKPATTLPHQYQKYQRVFDPVEAEKLPPHRPGLDHEINLRPGKRPPFGPIYNLSQDELVVLRAYLDKMLAQGFIRPSKSEAAAPLMFVNKKDGTLRPCVDFRGLNAITIPNRYPIPLISEILNRLGEASVYTKLDLLGAYNLIRIAQGHEWKTAFRTRFGSFEYLVMPFGLCNAPATFQAYIDQCLREYIDVFVIVYLDDILIFSKTLASHEDDVSRVLAQLEAWGLYCKLEKCVFGSTEVEFLGYIVTPSGIGMDKTRVLTILRWPTPGSAREVLSFLGFCNFYRRFIHAYSLVAMGMTKLLKGKQVFQWTVEAGTSFKQLQKAFEDAPLLVHFRFELKVWLECDASIVALAGIISQRQEDTHLHPIAFYSRKFIPAEINYTTFDQELLAIVESMKHWRHYLEGAQHKVTVISDHNNLQYFMTTRTLTRRQARWAITLSTIDFEIIHRAGSKNPADAPSRRPDYTRDPRAQAAPLLQSGEKQDVDTLLMLEGEEDILHLIVKAACDLAKPVRVSHLREISMLALSEEEETQFDDLATLIQKCQDQYPDPIGPQFTKEDGLWIYEGTRFYIPADKTLQKTLMQEFHDSPTAGHFGRDRTLLSMKRLFYWEGMSSDIEDFCVSCQACKRAKNPRGAAPGELAPLPVPSRPWGSISMDLITDLPRAKLQSDFPNEKGGDTPTYDAILVMVCRLTKEPEFVPVTKEMNSFQLAHIVLERIFSRHGMPDDLVSDRGSIFTSAFWSTLTKSLHATRGLSTAFHPQTDGQTERMNAILETYLRIYVQFNQEDWPDFLCLAKYAWCCSPSPVTKISPFEANGIQIKPFQISTIPGYKSESAQELSQRLSSLHRTLKENLLHAQDIQAKYYDAKHKRLSFQIGQLVYLSTKNLTSNQPCKKLGPKRVGPFQVLETIGTQAYRIKIPESWNIHDVFHVSLLSPFQGAARVDRSAETLQTPGPELVMNDQGDEAEEWEIEQVLDSKVSGRWKKLYYLVRWKGWGADHDSWHKAEDLEHAQEALNDFHRVQPLKPGGEDIAE